LEASRAPENITSPPLNDGTDERRCLQAAGGWFPSAIGFVSDWFDPNVMIDETDWIMPPSRDIEYPPPKEAEEREKEDCLFLDVMVLRQIYNKKDKPGFKKGKVTTITSFGSTDPRPQLPL